MSVVSNFSRQQVTKSQRLGETRISAGELKILFKVSNFFYHCLNLIHFIQVRQ